MILNYFEEEKVDGDGYCCDICSQEESKTADGMEEVMAIVKAVKDIPNKGEKKVKTRIYISK